jgi:hypothetical protein
MGIAKMMMPVPLFNLKSLIDIAASSAGTSNRRHWASLCAMRAVH